MNAVFVVGAGSWGTALALELARNGQQVRLWDVDGDHVRLLQEQHENARHLPGYVFPDNLQAVETFAPRQDVIEDIVIVVPCEALATVLENMRDWDMGGRHICLASKGLAPGSLKMNHEVVADILGPVPVAVLSGPSFAGEVAAAMPTAVAIASNDPDTAERFSRLFHNEYFRIYTNDDIVGVQVGGAVKNVMAIAAGIADGLGYGANTRSALITRGLAEIIRLGVAMGGRPETFMGLAGVGDLILTCTDNQSRNRRFGMALAKGVSPEQARAEIGQAVEGIRTTAAVASLAERFDVDMPISRQVKRVIDGEVDVREAVHDLLMRGPRPETE